MTIKEIIDKLDERKPNSYSLKEKMDWLSDIDGRIMDSVMCAEDKGELERYTDVNTVLLAEDTYCDMYIYYLMAQIDFFNGEYARYNNSSEAFNTAYTEYIRHYKRSHLPKAIHWKNL